MSPVDSPSPHDTGFGSVTLDWMRRVTVPHWSQLCHTSFFTNTGICLTLEPFSQRETPEFGLEKAPLCLVLLEVVHWSCCSSRWPHRPQGPRTVLWGHEKAQLQRQPRLSPCSLFSSLSSSPIWTDRLQNPPKAAAEATPHVGTLGRKNHLRSCRGTFFFFLIFGSVCGAAWSALGSPRPPLPRCAGARPPAEPGWGHRGGFTMSPAIRSPPGGWQRLGPRCHLRSSSVECIWDILLLQVLNLLNY